ncbi:MAG: DUF2059 domain-containing protein [Polymorphobacter sp.]
MLNLLTAVVVAAAPAAAPPSVDPAAMAAATALVRQLDVRGQFNRVMAQNVAAMRSGYAMRAQLAQQPGFAQAYRANKAKFDPVLQKAGAIEAEVAQKVITANVDAVVAETARVYARNYSTAELKGLADFYRSPLGKALYTRQGKVTAEISRASAQIIGTKIQAAMQANAPRLKAALAPLNSPAK